MLIIINIQTAANARTHTQISSVQFYRHNHEVMALILQIYISIVMLSQLKQPLSKTMESYLDLGTIVSSYKQQTLPFASTTSWILVMKQSFESFSRWLWSQSNKFLHIILLLFEHHQSPPSMCCGEWCNAKHVAMIAHSNGFCVPKMRKRNAIRGTMTAEKLKTK